jgi:hypothetical protein
MMEENFHPNRFFLRHEPWAAKTVSKHLLRRQQQKESVLPSHGVLIWILRIYVTLPSHIWVIDEVCVENHHENEIKALNNFRWRSRRETFKAKTLI